jgi:anti-sigma B factor antagonist
VHHDFTVEVSHDDRGVVLSVTGELDLASSPALEGALTRASAAHGERVVLDLRGVSFMDSTGLSVLVSAQRDATESGRQLAVITGSDQVLRLLTLTGVAERLTLIDAPERPRGIDAG